MQADATIGLLHPGAMGAAVGAQLVLAGHRVLWCSEGRTAATTDRANQAGLDDVGNVAALVAASDLIFSIAPPAAATDVAASVQGFSGVFVDANAISPATSREVGEIVAPAGAVYVDGGIIGGPPAAAGDVRIYLSGPQAADVAALFVPTVVDARVVSDRVGDASALKVAYAGWTKGSSALLLAMRDYAAREGVQEALLIEWSQSQPELGAKLRQAEKSRVEKGWRWVGEMNEIADSLGAVDVPEGFHRAAAEIYDGVARPL